MPIDDRSDPPEPARDLRARDLLGPAGPLADAFARYEDRPQQLAMADAVERALRLDQTLLCEAGTGTGKTLAYLVPAILSGRKIVVSTATKALEDQIFTSDLPLIASLLRLDPQATLVKGLGNYLCLRRYNELRKSPGGLGSSVTRALPLVERWARDTDTGDVAELVALAEGDLLWREISSSSETRIGSSCSYFDDCFVTRMKRDMERARLLIVNHHLFFADLAVKAAAARRGWGGAGVLPPYDAVIFDEAHQLEDIATEFFGSRLSRARVDTMLRDADRAFVAAGLADRILGHGQGTALSSAVRGAADVLFDRVARLVGAAEGKVLLAEDAWSGAALEAYYHLDSTLEALEQYAKANSKIEAIDLVAKRASLAREDAAKIVDPAVNQVKWAEARGRSVSVGASPVELGRLFRQEVVERVGAVVFTSATLTVGGGASVGSVGAGSGGEGAEKPAPTKTGGFAFFRSRMGLVDDLPVTVEELALASPFSFERAAVLYTPKDLPEASDAAFARAASERIAELIEITGGGAFVLCTSFRGMTSIAESLARLLGKPPMVQGDAPKGALLDRFRADRHAVLVGTMSFWEGVDVPGEALRLVVIEKIPFAVPSDPIVAARCAAIEKEGGNPFVAYSVPQAAITLKQGFGRLIRTQTDRGIVAILDKRVRTRGYGRILLDSLPKARRTDSIEDVKRFWADAKADSGA